MTNLVCGDRISDPPPTVKITQGVTRDDATSSTPVVAAESSNWSGYILTGVDYDHQYYSEVWGAWAVTQMCPPNSTSQLSASQWVGIGSGDQSWDQLLQAGTVSEVGPGKCASGTDVIPNSNSNGAVAQQAEWIMERHTYNGHITQLLDFGSPTAYVNNGYGEMDGAGVSQDNYTRGQGPSIQAADGVDLQNMTMMNCGLTSPTLATIGAVDSSGDFDLTWHASGNTC